MDLANQVKIDLNQSAQVRLSEFTARAELEFTRQLYERGAAGIPAGVINGLLVSLVLWGHVPSLNIVLWYTAVLILSVYRYRLMLSFRAAGVTVNDFRPWQNKIVSFLFVSGLVWGSLGIFLYPAESVNHQVFLAFILGGMVVGAVAVDSALFRAFLAYAIPTIVPFSIRFMLEMDLMHVAMGLMALMYLVALTLVARLIYKANETKMFLDFEKTE